jgi:hypothetical protein
MRHLSILIVFIFLKTSIALAELTDSASGKQIASFVKDAENQELLEGTKEFQQCRDQHSFDSKKSDHSEQIKKAEECFQKKITSGGRNLKQLEEISQKLDLENYKLIKSKNILEIQKYLNDKMYKSLTGIDRNEKNLEKLQEALKFGQRKMINHEVFLELYITQLGKNALYEVSRFCFENLRKASGPNDVDSFAEYWGNYSYKSLRITELNDKGVPKFGSKVDTGSKDKIYYDIFKSIQGKGGKGLNDQQLANFFIECGKNIVPLCEKFQKEITLKKQGDMSGAACISKDRLQEYKKAISKAEKILDTIKKNNEIDDKSIDLILTSLSNDPINLYGYGKNPNEESINDLTNYTSADMLEGTNFDFQDKIKRCTESPELPNCEGLITDRDSLDKAKFEIEREISFQRLTEMERIKKIVDEDRTTLQVYLENNGYYDILKKYKEGTLEDKDVAKEVGNAFEAKKSALLEQINLKLGRRQVSQSVNGTNPVDKNAISEVVKEVNEEKSRLAQMLLFHNIISSRLEFRDLESKKNFVNNNWSKEKNALESGKINSNLFQNIKSVKGNTISHDKNLINFNQFLGED